MVMDGFSAILVAVPLVLPFAAHFGLGPFHLAIMFVLNLELAFSCPPLGLNLFISSFRFSRPVLGLYRVVLPFVGLLAIALLVVTYAPRLSSMLVDADVERWRAQAARENRVPGEAWFLECVQMDRNNPRPCTEADKRAFPNGAMPAPAASSSAPVDAGAPSADDDDLDSIIRGGAKDAGKPSTPAETDDDLLAAIKGGRDAGAADAGKKAAPKPGQESDDELLNLIKGN
jgi:hypothetical protein